METWDWLFSDFRGVSYTQKSTSRIYAAYPLFSWSLQSYFTFCSIKGLIWDTCVFGCYHSTLGTLSTPNLVVCWQNLQHFSVICATLLWHREQKLFAFQPLDQPEMFFFFFITAHSHCCIFIIITAFIQCKIQLTTRPSLVHSPRPAEAMAKVSRIH